MQSSSFGLAFVAVGVLTVVGAAAGDERVASVEVSSVIWQPPQGGDGLPHVALSWLDAGGSRHALREADSSYVHGISFQGAALALDADGTLWRIDARGERLQVGTRVVDGPIASPDGKMVGWFSARTGEPSELWTYDGKVTRRLEKDLAGSAGLRFSPAHDTVAFVSARNGGIAGLWVTPTAPNRTRCLTNCELRVGTLWRAQYRALPDLDTLEFVNGVIRYRDLDGQAQEVTP